MAGHMRFVCAEGTFRLSGIPAPGFPLMVCADGGLFEAGHVYLRELAVMGQQAQGTLHDVAGIICGWFNYLASRDAAWDCPREDVFLRWALDAEGLGPNAARRRRRANVVFAFYEHLERSGWASSGIRDFIDDVAAPIDANVFTDGLKVRRSLRLSFGRMARQKALRPTPNEAEVESICTGLLRDGEAYHDIRDWLLARTAYETNLRTQGLAQLTTGHVDSMLRQERILDQGGNVAAFSRDSHAKAMVRMQLDELELLGRRFLILDGMREKAKTRSVRFPILLVRQILEFIWMERAKFLSSGRAGASQATAGAHLWVSTKTGRALARGSIADILKEGFRGAGVKGSGHRLRAAHAVRLFREFVREARANGGGKFDAEAILDRVAQIMGHAHPDTLRPYLHSVMLEGLVSSEGPERPSGALLPTFASEPH